MHNYFKCPAKNTGCNFCNKIDYWVKVYRSKRKQKVSAAVRSRELCIVQAVTSHCLSSSTIFLLLNNYTASALIDSVSSCSSMDNKLARRLQIKIKPAARYIILAMSSKHAPIKEVCNVNISLNNRTYHNTQLELIENFC